MSHRHDSYTMSNFENRFCLLRTMDLHEKQQRIRAKWDLNYLKSVNNSCALILPLMWKPLSWDWCKCSDMVFTQQPKSVHTICESTINNRMLIEPWPVPDNLGNFQSSILFLKKLDGQWTGSSHGKGRNFNREDIFTEFNFAKGYLQFRFSFRNSKKNRVSGNLISQFTTQNCEI